MQGNNITGGLPDAYSTWTNLQFLLTTSSPIGGTLPAYLGTFPRLGWVSLGTSGLTGTIPDTYFTFWPYMLIFDISSACATRCQLRLSIPFVVNRRLSESYSASFLWAPLTSRCPFTP
jgi:hypothetical protein